MTAAETIAAAIEKLEAQRHASTPGPWIAYDMSDDHKGWWWVWQESALPFFGGVLQIDHTDDFGDGGTPVGSAERTGNRDGEQERTDAELIVTLHRTIDAQLAILRNQLVLAERGHGESTLNLDLARAILGDS